MLIKFPMKEITDPDVITGYLEGLEIIIAPGFSAPSNEERLITMFHDHFNANIVRTDKAQCLNNLGFFLALFCKYPLEMHLNHQGQIAKLRISAHEEAKGEGYL